MRDIESFLTQITEQIQQVEGVAALVLGGSRARGVHAPTSDIDLGIYYHPDRPPNLAGLRRIAAAWDDAHRADILTPLGEWGPWINGGGWLTVQGIGVDFLYRDLGRVTAVVAACCAGQVEMAYQPGHPHGFVSAIYMGEVAVCRPLWEAHGAVSTLKAATQPYPAALQAALIGRFGWEIGFALDNAAKSAGRGDVAYVAGCAFRAVACMVQVIFARNEQYCLNEKGAVALAATFARCPQDFRARVAAAFSAFSAEPAQLAAGLAILDGLAQELRE